MARRIPRTDRLLVLLSGGASSLMAVPAPGITLEEKRQATAVLLRSGADIYALNTVRKHMSAIKGGRLAAAAAAECRSLVVSDVIGDDLSFIGSGPTVADETTFADARGVLDTFGGVDEYPAAVVASRRRRPRRTAGNTQTGRSAIGPIGGSGHRRAFQRDARRCGRGTIEAVPCRRARGAGHRRIAAGWPTLDRSNDCACGSAPVRPALSSSGEMTVTVEEVDEAAAIRSSRCLRPRALVRRAGWC
jgi:hydroxypyruvate reductase